MATQHIQRLIEFAFGLRLICAIGIVGTLGFATRTARRIGFAIEPRAASLLLGLACARSANIRRNFARARAGCFGAFRSIGFVFGLATYACIARDFCRLTSRFGDFGAYDFRESEVIAQRIANLALVFGRCFAIVVADPIDEAFVGSITMPFGIGKDVDSPRALARRTDDEIEPAFTINIGGFDLRTEEFIARASLIFPKRLFRKHRTIFRADEDEDMPLLTRIFVFFLTRRTDDEIEHAIAIDIGDFDVATKIHPTIGGVKHPFWSARVEARAIIPIGAHAPCLIALPGIGRRLTDDQIEQAIAIDIGKRNRRYLPTRFTSAFAFDDFARHRSARFDKSLARILIEIDCANVEFFSAHCFAKCRIDDDDFFFALSIQIDDVYRRSKRRRFGTDEKCFLGAPYITHIWQNIDRILIRP